MLIGFLARRGRRDTLTVSLLGLGLIMGVLPWGCAREAGPEAVALEYGRALYAHDPGQAYRLISSEDRRVKDEETFRREWDPATGFALEVARQLASFIEATPVEKTIMPEQATIKLRLRLPDAMAPEIAALVQEWDEKRLNALSQTEREEIMRKLNQLHRAKKIPMVVGEETLELVREGSGWRIFLNWAGPVRVRFHTAIPQTLLLEAAVSPEEVRVRPGELVQVTVRAKNLSTRDIAVTVGHRIEPKAHAPSLALLRCLLFIPVTLKPGQTEEFFSEYLVRRHLPVGARQFDVTYEFLPVERGEEVRTR
jgi:hypothetical protein